MTTARRTAKALFVSLCLAVPVAAQAGDAPSTIPAPQSAVDQALQMHTPDTEKTAIVLEYMRIPAHHTPQSTETPTTEPGVGILKPGFHSVRPSTPQVVTSARVSAAQPAPPTPTGLLLPAVQKVQVP